MANRDRKEKIGFADVVVVEEIYDVGAEVVSVENPAMEGDGYAELMFFIALAVELDESEVVGVCKLN